ncbi:MAG TPA: class A beta-lactamase-related serine hydrolase [Acidobacteria bacterium]|nr:class A beta-lactamase-related serine hydrolase [Acidobacteriota bacterium]
MRDIRRGGHRALCRTISELVDFMYVDAKQLIDDAVRVGIFPAAVIEVGDTSGCQWTYAAGTIAHGDVSVDTVFDLASLTKVIATTSLVLRHVDAQVLDIDRPIRELVHAWDSDDRAMVTTRDLLRHSAGLTAHLPLFLHYEGRQEFESAICSSVLEYLPRSQAIYSDLGFMLLGFLLADIEPRQTPLDDQFRWLATDRDWGDLCFRPDRSLLKRVAPTELDHWRGRLLVGEVHDENCYALGGVSGHAGLFGTSTAVGKFARDTLLAISGESTYANTQTVQEFIHRTTVPGSSRALGWDTMLTSSSCGRCMSDEAFGHTGFTGTSLWIDPKHNKYVVLLTNRVNPTRENNGIVPFRPRLHDAIMREHQQQS